MTTIRAAFGCATTKKLSAAVLGLAVLATATSTLAGPPGWVRYQARLTDAAGVPLTGAHTLTFAIYDAAAGGARVWPPAAPETRNLVVQAGAVDLILGCGTNDVCGDGDDEAIPASALSDADRWLEVTVDAAVLGPRERLTGVPFALIAERANVLDAPDGNPTDVVFVDNAGNVGIGTNLPGSRLEVNGVVRATTADLTGGGNTKIELRSTAGGTPFIDFSNDAATDRDMRMLLRSDDELEITGGDVGIGRNPDGFALDVAGAVRSNDLQIEVGGGGDAGIALRSVDGGDPFIDFKNDSGTGFDMRIEQINQQRLRIRSNGGSPRLGIGVDPSEALEVDGRIRALDIPSGQPASQTLCSSSPNAGTIGRCGSARRFKQDIADLSLPGLETALRLRPVEFEWKSSGGRDLGFVAEEVAAVDRLLASFDEEGEAIGVKYGQLTAVLVKALQEQQRQIEALKAEVDRLKR